MANLNIEYGDQMKHHPYGYALFHPVSNESLNPGSVGFLDELGFWHPIANLEARESITAGANLPFSALVACKVFANQGMDPKTVFESQREVWWL